MSAPQLDRPAAIPMQDPVAAIRSRAISDALRFRQLARIARADGLPKSDLRAAHARSAARSVLQHARRVASLCAPADMAVAQAPASDSCRSTIGL